MARKPKNEVQKEESNEQVKPAQPNLVADLQKVRNEVEAIRQDNPDMAEAKQAVDSLDSAIYFVRQAQNTLQ